MAALGAVFLVAWKAGWCNLIVKLLQSAFGAPSAGREGRQNWRPFSLSITDSSKSVGNKTSSSYPPVAA
jgi:hypothetical protein